jgi:hypothetical protein
VPKIDFCHVCNLSLTVLVVQGPFYKGYATFTFFETKIDISYSLRSEICFYDFVRTLYKICAKSSTLTFDRREYLYYWFRVGGENTPTYTPTYTTALHTSDDVPSSPEKSNAA